MTAVQVVHILLAVFLFVGVNWIGSHAKKFGYLPLSVLAKADEAPAFNAVFRILAPVVGIILFSASFYAFDLDRFVEGIWLVALYYVAFRIGFNVVLGRARLLNWVSQLVLGGLIVSIAYGAYEAVIRDGSKLLPDFETVGNELWILMLLFLYSVANNVTVSREGTRRRKRRFIQRRLATLEERHGDLMTTIQDKDVRRLAYAILIYETFNRPLLYREIERWILFPLGLSKTLGAMQVTTDERISDRESVRRGIEKINRDYERTTEEAKERYRAEIESASTLYFRKALEDNFDQRVRSAALRETAAEFNRDDEYVSEVFGIYRQIGRLDEDEEEPAITSREPPPPDPGPTSPPPDRTGT